MTQSENKPPKALSRTVVALGVVSLLTDVSSEMVYTQVPIFLTAVLLVPKWIIGLIEGVAESTASLLRIYAGYISDRTGKRKPLTLLGYLFGAISKPIMALATSWHLVFGMRFLDRFGKGLRSAPRDAMIADVTPKEVRGKAFGFHRAMDTTGAILGPLIGILILRAIPGDMDTKLRGLFLFAGIPGLLAVLTLWFFVKEPGKAKQEPTADTKPTQPPKFPRWRDLPSTYRHYLLIMLLFGIGNSSDKFLILRAESVGFSPEQLLMLYAAFNVVEALLGYSAGSLSDRIGRRPLIIAGFFLFSIVYLGFGLITPNMRLGVWLLFLLYGGYYTLTQSVQRAFAADLADPAQRATQIGAFHLVVGIAAFPASLLAGILYDRNPSLPFLFSAITAITSALLLTRVKITTSTG